MKENRWILTACWLVMVLSTQFVNLSIPFGEQSATITCLAVVLPLLAYFIPAKYSLPIIAATWIALRGFHPFPLTCGIPTVLASLSLRYSKEKDVASFYLNFLYPLAAIALFAVAPAGKVAWPFALYWLIPAICYFLKPTVWSRAVQSTFIAHATGSLIWAYMVPLSGAQWLGLIPVVAIERILAVGLSVAFIQILSMVEHAIPVIRTRTAS